MTAPLALVTGGVRRVGATIATRLAEAGYALALHGHSDAQPEDSLKAALASKNYDWHGFTADFSNTGSAKLLIDMVTEHFGRAPDLLVNNASVFGQDDASSATAETLEEHLRVNMMLPTLLSLELAKTRPAGNRASVVHILDQRIINPHRDQLSYTLSKQALADSVRTLAVSCAEKLRVNGVAPGLTLTDGEYSAAQLTNITEIMPLNLLPDPDDIADAVLYFAGAKTVTGQILSVDGGASLKSFERDFIYLGK